MEQKVYKQIASTFMAYNHCIHSGNTEWIENHEKRLHDIMENYMPSGSGLDIGISFDFSKSKDDRLVMQSSYHLMDEMGGYDGWIDFEIIVKPSLAFDFTIDIKGPFSRLKSQYTGLKDYILQCNFNCLQEKQPKI